MTDETLLEFPCQFPIKIMGHNTPELEATVFEIVRRHVPDLGEGAITQRESRKSKYIALTVTITATSKQQLDALYTELSGHELTLMVL